MSYLSVGSASQFQSSAPGLGCSVQPANPGVAPGGGGGGAFSLLLADMSAANPPSLPGWHTIYVTPAACTITSLAIAGRNNVAGFGTLVFEVWDETVKLASATVLEADISPTLPLPYNGGVSFHEPIVVAFVEAFPGSLTVTANKVLIPAVTASVSVAPFTKRIDASIIFQPI